MPDAQFAPASIGARVWITTLLSFVAVLIVGTVVVVLMLQERRPPPWPVLVALGIALAVVAASWFTARIQRYRIVGTELQIERRFGTVRFSLEGLQSALPDRLALRGARKIIGNDGLRAIGGRFRSKRLGRFHAYVTDAEHAVVLRWSDRCLVISPQHPSWFVETVRKHAGRTA